jgi:NTE family protein
MINSLAVALLDHRQGAAADRGTAGQWPRRPRTWILAMDYSGGRRVVFGRPGDPPASISAAVQASCAIPGWYAPVLIDGRPYVDGGTCSPASVDVLADAELDEVWVLAPMVSFALDRPRSPVARVERRFRRAATRRVLAEATRVRESGTAVTMLGPGPEDLAVMGANLMDPRRRNEVLATSLRTSAAALRREGPGVELILPLSERAAQ